LSVDFQKPCSFVFIVNSPLADEAISSEVGDCFELRSRNDRFLEFPILRHSFNNVIPLFHQEHFPCHRVSFRFQAVVIHTSRQVESPEYHGVFAGPV